MENKINIAELLRGCPKGTKLYSPLVGECALKHIHSELKKILISTSDGTTLTFNNNGTYFQMDNSECLLFPSKDQRDWSKFQRPFKDGDIVATESGKWIGITTGGTYNESIPTYCIIDPNNSLRLYFDKPKSWSFNRLATEEEKEKLFQAIKDNGYRWNANTKTLEKLIKPKFNVGDVIQDIDTYKVKITEVNIEDECYGYESMIAKGIGSIGFNEQDNWELAPDKFDINTLKPFESRVLVRNHNHHYWRISFFGFFDKNKCVYDTIRGIYSQCIPYEGNEHLCGTTNDCDNYYKTW